MATLTKRIKRTLTYYFAVTAIWVLNLLPRKLALWLGRQLGLFAWRLIPRDRLIMEQNLKLVYGDRLTVQERTEIGRNFFANSGKNLVDVVRFRNHFKSEIAPLVEVEGLEHFDAAYRAGRGLIGITGHIGNFELLAAYVQSRGYEIGVIGRQMYDQRLDHLLVQNRISMGLSNFQTTDSPKRILHWLKTGHALGVLIDTDSMRVRNIQVPFFGRPAATPVSLTAMGLKVGSAFVPLACVRIPGDRYKVIIKPALEITPTGNQEQDLYNVTLLCNKALEDIIDRHRDQWIWLHRRWHVESQNTP